MKYGIGQAVSISGYCVIVGVFKSKIDGEMYYDVEVGKDKPKLFGVPEDIAELAVFLCSARSAFITGAIFSVDGGTMVVEHPWKAWQ